MIAAEPIILILSLYLVSIFLLSLLKPNYVNQRKIYLFRCLFPSWKFYEDLSYIPILYYRSSLDGITFGDWQPAVEKISRNWRNLCVNSEGNLVHAYNSLLLQVESDKEDFTGKEQNEFVDSVSYQLARNLVEYKARAAGLNGQYVQFRITSTMQGDPADYEDTLISLVHLVPNE